MLNLQKLFYYLPITCQYCLVLFSLISYSNLDGNLYILHYVTAKMFTVSRKHATTVKHLNTVLITLGQTKPFYNQRLTLQ